MGAILYGIILTSFLVLASPQITIATDNSYTESLRQIVIDKGFNCPKVTGTTRISFWTYEVNCGSNKYKYERALLGIWVGNADNPGVVTQIQ